MVIELPMKKRMGCLVNISMGTSFKLAASQEGDHNTAYVTDDGKVGPWKNWKKFAIKRAVNGCYTASQNGQTLKAF